MKDLIIYLRSKYSFQENPIDFGNEFNEKINAFYANQSNVDSFITWVKESGSKLNLDLQPMASTFFPSLSFSAIYEILEFQNFKIYKEEIFCISFIEDYYTSQFNTYIKEKKENGKVTYKPTKTPIRDTKFEDAYDKIVDVINKQYPNKEFLDIKLTNRILGDFKLTYSNNQKTSIFELLFRTELE